MRKICEEEITFHFTIRKFRRRFIILSGKRLSWTKKSRTIVECVQTHFGRTANENLFGFFWLGMKMYWDCLFSFLCDLLVLGHQQTTNNHNTIDHNATAVLSLVNIPRRSCLRHAPQGNEQMNISIRISTVANREITKPFGFFFEIGIRRMLTPNAKSLYCHQGNHNE